MHESSIGANEERQIFQRVLGHYDAPAFVRRVRRLEDAERILVEHLALKRHDWLATVRLRVGQLRVLAGDWSALAPLVHAKEGLEDLRALHDALEPTLRVPLASTRSVRTLRRALHELTEAIDTFNRRWQRYIAEFDLKPINELRDGYNRYYLIEKECAVGNARVARMGFHRLDPLIVEELLRQFPLLSNPCLGSTSLR